jgi:hypothetical protein
MMKISIDFQFSIEITKSKGIVVQASRRSWKRIRQIVRRRDGAVCQYCGSKAPDGHVDHIIPLSRGGTDSVDNLLWSCAFCNISKGAKSLDEWGENQEHPQSAPAINALDLTGTLTSELEQTLRANHATGHTRVIITSVNTTSSRRIVRLSDLWNIIIESYFLGDWTRDGWATRGISQKKWADLKAFLLYHGFWEIPDIELYNFALEQLYCPDNTPERTE